MISGISAKSESQAIFLVGSYIVFAIGIATEIIVIKLDRLFGTKSKNERPGS